MPRQRTRVDEPDRALAGIVEHLGNDRVPMQRRMEHLEVLRGGDAERGRHIDQQLLTEIARLRTAVREAGASQEQLRQLHERLTAEPWYQVMVRDILPADRVVVMHRGDCLVVGVADGLDAASLRRGDMVFLGSQLNVIMDRSPAGTSQSGELATFERLLPDGRLVLKQRGDQNVVVDVGSMLDSAALQPNDLIRWNKVCAMALEKISRTEESRFMLEEAPSVGRDQVGGQDDNIERLVSALTASLAAPEKAAQYNLTGRQSILMVGPPGCGKTHMTRVVTAEIARRNGSGCRFAVVKPGEFESPYVGETQQRIRSCFAALQRAAQEGFVVLFLDEIESVGRIRGGWVGHHSDKFLAALLAELDGFESRSNVAVIAATNRKDLIDPALLERISDVEIAVNRPDMRAARAIFEIHLPEPVPYHHNGREAVGTRRELIDLAVSRLYCPNSDGHELCVIRFRDGKTRTVTAGELMSGRCIEQICRAARRAALWRDVQGGDQGLCAGDIETAVTEALTRLSTTLNRNNVHAYLTDLPQDVDVVSVESVVRRVPKGHDYLSVA